MKKVTEGKICPPSVRETSAEFPIFLYIGTAISLSSKGFRNFTSNAAFGNAVRTSCAIQCRVDHDFVCRNYEIIELLSGNQFTTCENNIRCPARK